MSIKHGVIPAVTTAPAATIRSKGPYWWVNLDIAKRYGLQTALSLLGPGLL
jgi:hypothetical protein